MLRVSVGFSSYCSSEPCLNELHILYESPAELAPTDGKEWKLMEIIQQNDYRRNENQGDLLHVTQIKLYFN